MRKIKTMADAEKTRRRNNIILGVVMIGLLVASSLGYSLMSVNSDSSNSVEEFGFDFFRVDGRWKTLVGESVFGFQYLPSEVEDVDVNVSVDLGVYSGKVLYFVNPNEGASEILNDIGVYILRYQEACLASGIGDLEFGISEEDLRNFSVGDNESVNFVCNGDLPLKDCSNNLIIFGPGNETRVYGDGNCVYIVGDSLRGADAFLYEILGVRKW